MLRSRSMKQPEYWQSSSQDLPSHMSPTSDQTASFNWNTTYLPARRGQVYATSQNHWTSRNRLRLAFYLLLVFSLVSLGVSFRETVCSTLGCFALGTSNKASLPVPLPEIPPPVHGLKRKSQQRSPRPTVARQQLLDLGLGESEHDVVGPKHDIVNLRWPPMVTAIPEVVPSPEALKAGITSRSVDAQFCNNTNCRFLFPLWIGEQESRGRMHLMQVVHLASTLNRTLVLPNVGKNRIGGCGKWPFDAYYDVPEFARQVQELVGTPRKLINMDDFKTWLDMRPDRPITQMMFFDENSTAVARDPLESTLVLREDPLDIYADLLPLNYEDTRLKNARCLQKKLQRLDVNARYPISVRLATGDPPSVVIPGSELVAVLQRDDISYASMRPAPNQVPSLQDIVALPSDTSVSSIAQNNTNESDVLMVHWDLRHFPFPAPTPSQGLSYSSRIHQLASKLTASHEPYVAVHWRMETVNPELLPDCAEALVDSLSVLLADPTLGAGIRTVWLATDFPWSGSGMHIKMPEQRSNTFRNVSREHAEALETLKAAFEPEGPLEGWRLTGLAQEMERVHAEMKASGTYFMLDEDDEHGRLWEDSGIWGILDKIAAMDSALFVSAARGCGRVSSFTKQIVDFRTDGQGRYIPRNVVELFG